MDPPHRGSMAFSEGGWEVSRAPLKWGAKELS